MSFEEPLKEANPTDFSPQKALGFWVARFVLFVFCWKQGRSIHFDFWLSHSCGKFVQKSWRKKIITSKPGWFSPRKAPERFGVQGTARSKLLKARRTEELSWRSGLVGRFFQDGGQQTLGSPIFLKAILGIAQTGQRIHKYVPKKSMQKQSFAGGFITLQEFHRSQKQTIYKIYTVPGDTRSQTRDLASTQQQQQQKQEKRRTRTNQYKKHQKTKKKTNQLKKQNKTKHKNKQSKDTTYTVSEDSGTQTGPLRLEDWCWQKPEKVLEAWHVIWVFPSLAFVFFKGALLGFNSSFFLGFLVFFFFFFFFFLWALLGFNSSSFLGFIVFFIVFFLWI